MLQFQIPYWKAYQDITGSRQYTASGIADIPYSEKVSWLNENDIDDPDERADFLYMISILDATFLEHYYEKNKVK